MTQKKSKKGTQQLVVVVAALIIIAASVGSTLYFTGVFAGFSAAGGGSGYQNVTFTDAFLECEHYTRDRYAARLQTLTPDNHSSRLDHATNEYKIFFRLQMRKPPSEPMPQPYWVNCFVSARDGDISHYEVGEAKNIPPQPAGKERGGAFGWP